MGFKYYIRIATILYIFVCMLGCTKVRYVTADRYKYGNNETVLGLSEKIDDLYNDNAYIKVQVGESKYNYVRLNSKGESYNSDGLVGLKDGTIVSLNTEDDIVYHTKEGTYLTEIQCALALASKDKATLSVTKEEDIAIYTVQLYGEDVIKEYYGLISDGDSDFTNMAYEVLLQSITDTNSLYIKLQIAVDTANEDNNGFSALSSFGDSENEYTAWIIEGYISTDIWELESEWYNASLTADKYKDMLKYLDEHTNIDLVLSNNALFDMYSSNILYKEYEKSDEKNTIIEQIKKDLEEFGMEVTMDNITLKKRLVEFYSDKTFRDVPLLKATAYICALNSELEYSEEEINLDITQENENTSYTYNENSGGGAGA